MKSIKINNKEHKCSNDVYEHIRDLEIKLQVAISLSDKVSDKLDELETQHYQTSEKLNNLLQEIKNL